MRPCYHCHNNIGRFGASTFRGVDQFQVGTPVPRTTCNFTIDGLNKKTGDIMTPTYPGVYPKDLTCAYRFLGKKGQRIRLEFRDFDTFYGGPQLVFLFISILKILLCKFYFILFLAVHWIRSMFLTDSITDHRSLDAIAASSAMSSSTRRNTNCLSPSRRSNGRPTRRTVVS